MSSSRNFLVSLSSAGSFSVRIRMPVSCGAKMWASPFLISDLETACLTFSERSMNSISPWVEKVRLVLTILKGVIVVSRFRILSWR